MPSLLDIRRRVRAVKSTQQITKAMKMVAASKLRRAQERILNARPFAHQMLRVLNGLAGRIDSSMHPLLADPAVRTGRTLIFVITADKGLCGSFNTNIIKTAGNFAVADPDREVALGLVGRKGRDFFSRRGFDVRYEITNLFGDLSFNDAQEIAEVAKQHEDFVLFESLPGAGPAYASRLLVAFGEQRDRYASAAELQKYAGIAPVIERSGKKNWVHWRYQCPKFLRQTFVEWAAQTINKSYWAGEYYRQQREKGCKYQVAVRALAFKWIRILFRCWQTHAPYDESAYLKALKRRGSPLVNPEIVEG